MTRATLVGRLTRNFSASLLTKAAVSIYRVAIIPLLIWFLGAERYGEWLLLSALPSWLSLSSFSLGSVAANAMTMHAAGGDLREARAVYSTTIVALAAFAAVGLAVAGMVLGLVSRGVFALPGQSTAVAGSTLLAIGLLCGSVFVSFFAEPCAARLRAAGKADIGIAIGATMPLIEAACCVLGLVVRADFVGLAAATLAARCIYVAVNWWISRRAHADLFFSWPDVRPPLLIPLLSKGLAYQALPLGHALSNQAMLMVVGAATGPAAVAIFGTARTMVRLGTQAMELINFAVWPEMSLLLGAGDFRRAAGVHRAAAAFTICAGLAVAVGAAVAGPWIFGVWTLHELSVTHGLMAIFGLSMLLQSLWHASLIVQLAANRHEGVAVRYVLGALLAVALCYPLSRAWGLYGAAGSTLIVDALLIRYSVASAVSITHDTFGAFVAGLVPAVRSGVARARGHAVVG